MKNIRKDLSLPDKTALPIITIQQPSIALEKTSKFYMDSDTLKKKHTNASHCLPSSQALLLNNGYL
jgi:hypothetical protein